MIEGDIRGYFDNVDHDILLSLCKKTLNIDKTLIGIITKFIKAGYIHDGEYKHSITGMPQGGTLSPLLSNLYLHPLDMFMESKAQEIRKSQVKVKGQINAISRRNPEYRKIEWQIANLRTKLKRPTIRTLDERKIIKSEIVRLGRELRTIPSVLREQNQIHYVRYADNFVVGVTGTHKYAQTIKQELRDFFKDNLKLELSEDKTKITHLSSSSAKFLGYDVIVNSSTQNNTRRRVSRIKGVQINVRKSSGKPKLLANKTFIKNKLISKGLANSLGKPQYVGKFI